MKKANFTRFGIGSGLMILLFWVLASCGQQSTEPVRRVLVIHQSESAPNEYGIHVESLYTTALKSHKLSHHVEIRHFYLNFPQMTAYNTNCLEELQKEGWLPDVVLCHKDISLNYYAKCAEGMSEDIRQIPVLYVGVRYPDNYLATDLGKLPKQLFKHITGFRDSVHFGKNLKFFQEVTGNDLCTVITDSVSQQTKLIYKQLNEYLKQYPKDYVDNMDCHIEDLYSLDGKNQHNGGKIIVTAISFMYPQLNGKEGERMMQYALATAKEYRFMQVNYTAGTQVLLDLSGRPQMSVTNAQFDEKQKTRILGGYFVSLDQEVEDAVSLLQRVLAGEKAESIPQTNHKADYWLDWNAMQMWGMIYKDWKDKAHIINAPLRVSNPVLWALRTMLIWTFICAVLVFLIYKTQVWSFRKKALIRQKEREKQLLWILASDDGALWTLEENTIEFKSNMKELQQLCNRPISTQMFTTMIHPAGQEVIKELLNFQVKEGNYRTRFKMTLDNGQSYQWWEFIYIINPENVLLHRAKGRLLFVEETVRREKLLQEQLQAAEETNLRQSFLANISHDIRNPLSSIIGFSDLLIEDNPFTQEEKKEFIEIIRANTDIMLKLIDDVANLSKLQVGEYRYMRNSVSVSNLIDTAYTANGVLAHDNLQFEKQPDSRDVFIYVDFERTMQVLNNFLSNAFKYTPNGTVVIGWKVIDDQVELFVHDSGVGISDEKLAHVFDRFFLGDENHNGTGLGLYIVKMIVEQQGGQVGVESTIGKGSRFYASFPIYYGEKTES